LWLNAPDYDANTLLAKAEESNRRYVDAVITVPQNVTYSMSSMNLAFDKTLIGAAMFTPPIKGFISANTTNGTVFRGNSIDDIWAGFCSKSICDHFGYGVKSGLPYVSHNSSSTRDLEALHKDNKGLLLLDRIVPFFQSLRLPGNAMTVEDCYLDIAKQVRSRLSSVDPVFLELAASMEAWIEAWKTFSPR
jgi:reversibly glycosylated polypeptide/UDP-arabinopyranose mutase